MAVFTQSDSAMSPVPVACIVQCVLLALAVGHELLISEGRCGAYAGLAPASWQHVESRKRTALASPEDVSLALQHAPVSLRLGAYTEELMDVVEEYSGRCHGPYWSLELGGELCAATTRGVLGATWERVCANLRSPPAAEVVLATRAKHSEHYLAQASHVANASIACTCSTLRPLRDACEHGVAPFGEDSALCVAMEDDGCVDFHAFGGLCKLSEVVADRRHGGRYTLRALQQRFIGEREKDTKREHMRGDKRLLWGSWSDLKHDMRQGDANRHYHPPTERELYQKEAAHTTRRSAPGAPAQEQPPPFVTAKVAMLLTAKQRAGGRVHWNSVVRAPGPLHGDPTQEARRHGPRPFLLCAAGDEADLISHLGARLRNAHVHAISGADEAAILCSMLGFSRCPHAEAARSCTGILVREASAKVLLTDPCGVAETARHDAMRLARRSEAVYSKPLHGPHEHWGHRIPEAATRISKEFAKGMCNRHRHRALFHSSGGVLLLNIPMGEHSEREQVAATTALRRACAALTHPALPGGYRGTLAPRACAELDGL